MICLNSNSRQHPLYIIKSQWEIAKVSKYDCITVTLYRLWTYKYKIRLKTIQIYANSRIIRYNVIGYMFVMVGMVWVEDICSYTLLSNKDQH